MRIVAVFIAIVAMFVVVATYDLWPEPQCQINPCGLCTLKRFEAAGFWITSGNGESVIITNSTQTFRLRFDGRFEELGE